MDKNYPVSVSTWEKNAHPATVDRTGPHRSFGGVSTLDLAVLFEYDSPRPGLERSGHSPKRGLP
jgi:hypothetical protein